MNREEIYKKIYELSDDELFKLEKYIELLKNEHDSEYNQNLEPEDYENLLLESGIVGSTEEEIKNFLGENYLEELMNWKKN